MLTMIKKKCPTEHYTVRKGKVEELVSSDGKQVWEAGTMIKTNEDGQSIVREVQSIYFNGIRTYLYILEEL